MQLPVSPVTNTSPSAPVIRSSQATLSVSSADTVSLTPEPAPSSSVSTDSATPAQRPVPSAGEAPEANESAVFRPASTGAEEGTGEEAERSSRGLDRESGESSDEARAQDGPDAPGELAPEEREEVRELQARDQEVRQHEQAHQIVGGQYTGAVNYTLERGPDGQLYAVDGQVPIDTAPIPEDPQATIDKMRIVRAAALAPSEPSPQDLQVALEATRQMLAAQGELRAERQGEVREDMEDGEERDSDPRIEAFRNVAATQDPPAMQDSGTRVDAIA